MKHRKYRKYALIAFLALLSLTACRRGRAAGKSTAAAVEELENMDSDSQTAFIEAGPAAKYKARKYSDSTDYSNISEGMAFPGIPDTILRAESIRLNSFQPVTEEELRQRIRDAAAYLDSKTNPFYLPGKTDFFRTYTEDDKDGIRAKDKFLIRVKTVSGSAQENDNAGLEFLTDYDFSNEEDYSFWVSGVEHKFHPILEAIKGKKAGDSTEIQADGYVDSISIQRVYKAENPQEVTPEMEEEYHRLRQRHGIAGMIYNASPCFDQEVRISDLTEEYLNYFASSRVYQLVFQDIRQKDHIHSAKDYFRYTPVKDYASMVYLAASSYADPQSYVDSALRQRIAMDEYIKENHISYNDDAAKEFIRYTTEDEAEESTLRYYRQAYGEEYFRYKVIDFTAHKKIAEEMYGRDWEDKLTRDKTSDF